jgi:hypothetical protein
VVASHWLVLPPREGRPRSVPRWHRPRHPTGRIEPRVIHPPACTRQARELPGLEAKIPGESRGSTASSWRGELPWRRWQTASQVPDSVGRGGHWRGYPGAVRTCPAQRVLLPPTPTRSDASSTRPDTPTPCPAPSGPWRSAPWAYPTRERVACVGESAISRGLSVGHAQACAPGRRLLAFLTRCDARPCSMVVPAIGRRPVAREEWDGGGRCKANLEDRAHRVE